ncbi:acetyl-CoA carboxylase biotin carboxyl carrier protein [Psychrobacter sp. Ps6]|uniref:acetyl-CoA carboxylase biotin carboxyl carrier protein n=1 Tax=Psychrobacter sp. Ps6 TaxID=2790960 RepID=UPI001EDCD3F2|nr:acetyl-CoA carboxylase biotin carboxyl carrier protein [Psychrobacter sp. Ps6]MCG3879456.1 acetyl-CoA carboxylase biotin carboxyl carrier protein [Psychrobacter sp. Ps6]
MNINFDDLEKLIKIAENADIQSLEVTDGDARIAIVCHSAEQHTSQPSASTTSNAPNKQQATLASSDNDNNKHENDISDEERVDAPQKNDISAPMLGTFYRRSEPDADEFVSIGDQVEVGQTLCIIEAMKMMHEVKAETACIIKDILIEEGDIVEYGQALFVTEPAS